MERINDRTDAYDEAQRLLNESGTPTRKILHSNDGSTPPRTKYRKVWFQAVIATLDNAMHDGLVTNTKDIKAMNEFIDRIASEAFRDGDVTSSDIEAGDRILRLLQQSLYRS